MFNWFTVRKLRRLKEKEISDAVLKKHREELLVFMDKHPMRTPTRSSFFPALHIWKPFTAGLLSFVVLTMTSGAVYASQSSVPGEKLYPVKLVSEDVREHLAVSPEAKMRIKAERAERRLVEVEKLLTRIDSQGKRHAQVQLAMQKYEDHIVKMEDLAERIGEKGNDEAERKILIAIDRVVERHDNVIDSASSTEDGSDYIIIRPIERSLKLEERFRKSVEQRREKLQENDDEHYLEMKIRTKRLRESYRVYQEKKQESEHERD